MLLSHTNTYKRPKRNEEEAYIDDEPTTEPDLCPRKRRHTGGRDTVRFWYDSSDSDDDNSLPSFILPSPVSTVPEYDTYSEDDTDFSNNGARSVHDNSSHEIEPIGWDRFAISCYDELPTPFMSTEQNEVYERFCDWVHTLMFEYIDIMTRMDVEYLDAQWYILCAGYGETPPTWHIDRSYMWGE